MALGVVRAPLSPSAAFCSVKGEHSGAGWAPHLVGLSFLAESLLGREWGFQCRAAGGGALARGLEFFQGGWTLPTPSHSAGAAAVTVTPQRTLHQKDFPFPASFRPGERGSSEKVSFSSSSRNSIKCF